MSLARVHRPSFSADLARILGVRAWTAQQAAGIERLLSNFEIDALIPAGKVGIQRCAYWFYTDWIETGHTFTPIMERGSASYFIRMYGPNTARGRRLGNDTDEEAILLRGAGDVQLTGENNREAAEKLIRRDYPQMVAQWEAANGRMWDLTIGDQPDDHDDWKNALIPEFSYAIMVAGTTAGLFGARIDRYINDRQCAYGEARRCVNGTDRAGEFVKFCPLIEKALRVAIAKQAGIVTAPLPDPSAVTAELPAPDAQTPATPSAGVLAAVGGGGAVAVAGGAAVASSGYDIPTFVWVLLGVLVVGVLTVVSLWALSKWGKS